MKYYSFSDYARFFGLLLLGALLGWAVDAFWPGLVGALVVWTLIQHREYTTFRRWAVRPLRRPEFATDAWQNAADILFRSGRRQRDRAHVALAQLRNLQSVTEALPDAAIVLDPSGRIERFNAAARRQLRMRRSDLGLPFVELVRHPQVMALVQSREQREPVEFASPSTTARGWKPASCPWVTQAPCS
ncbi:MAG: PAS domain-containing protein [Pseudomonadales bacterium]